MKTCRKCGEKLYNHNFTMCDTCEGNSILAVIIRTSDDKRKLEKKEMKAKKQRCGAPREDLSPYVATTYDDCPLQISYQCNAQQMSCQNFSD